MVMFIVSDSLFNQFFVIAHLSFHFGNKFAVNTKFLGMETKVIVFWLI